jgi:hypothetical protein
MAAWSASACASAPPQDAPPASRLSDGPISPAKEPPHAHRRPDPYPPRPGVLRPTQDSHGTSVIGYGSVEHTIVARGHEEGASLSLWWRLQAKQDPVHSERHETFLGEMRKALALELQRIVDDLSGHGRLELEASLEN